MLSTFENEALTAIERQRRLLKRALMDIVSMLSDDDMSVMDSKVIAIANRAIKDANSINKRAMKMWNFNSSLGAEPKGRKVTL